MFKKGLFFGSLLGAGLTWMSTTKQGRAMREQLLDHAAGVYEDVKKKALASPQARALQKNKYVLLVDEIVETYGKKYKLSPSTKRAVHRLVAAQWNTLKKELQGEAKKTTAKKTTKKKRK